MRLWSLHPKYLDAKGIVALWREGLLAKKVLENQTRGYRNHPQLSRFKESAHPLAFMNTYLHLVCDEAVRRGYSFDRSKLEPRRRLAKKISVQSGQVDYEWQHLMRKLKTRSHEDFENLKSVVKPSVHPLFKRTRGGIEPWEVT